MRNKLYITLSALLLIVLVFSHVLKLMAQDPNEVCMDCHGDKTLTGEVDGKEVSVYVNYNRFKNSVHAENGCTSCHWDVDPEDLPHDFELEKVDCSLCHDEVAEKYQSSLHGEAHAHGRYLAPTCITCHGKHDILSHKNERSNTYVMNIPDLCGQCHKEGTPVSQLRNVSKKEALENYSQSIHGEGLFQQGLIVTAVCTSCHNSHEILTHENPKSSINRNNIANTCMQCHAEIERVHKKVIKGELWEKSPHKIPVCVDCHQPHKIRQVVYDRSYPDSMCIDCHKDQSLTRIKNGQTDSLYVNAKNIHQSVHNGISCVKCHVNVSEDRHPVCEDSGPVDCSMCHTEQVDNFEQSQHAKELAKGNKEAPYCTDCHGTHKILSRKNTDSPTFKMNIPKLCGDCHSKGEKAYIIYKGEKREVLKNYSASIHGKALEESGLLVTATCVDCHTSHRELPASDPRSSVNRNNISQTCADCHLGIYKDFQQSIHHPSNSDTDEKLPVCNDCHFAHDIERVDLGHFRQRIIAQCGSCHEDVTESYFETFHGKVSKLGEGATAKCHDCHGSHKILPPENPHSTLSRQNIVQTCKKCHPNSNRKFVGYLTHATHHDKDKYPFLFYTFWFMTILLVSTFAFFGIHTLLWIPRSIHEKYRMMKEMKKKEMSKEVEEDLAEKEDENADENSRKDDISGETGDDENDSDVKNNGGEDEDRT